MSNPESEFAQGTDAGYKRVMAEKAYQDAAESTGLTAVYKRLQGLQSWHKEPQPEEGEGAAWGTSDVVQGGGGGGREKILRRPSSSCLPTSRPRVFSSDESAGPMVASASAEKIRCNPPAFSCGLRAPPGCGLVFPFAVKASLVPW